MPITLPPANVPVIDADGYVDPRWYEFFTRFDLRGMAQAWAYVTVSGGVPTLVDSLNVASIADGGAGILTITYETPFASASYSALAIVDSNMVEVFSRTAGAAVLHAFNFVPAVADPGNYNFVAFGAQ